MGLAWNWPESGLRLLALNRLRTAASTGHAALSKIVSNDTRLVIEDADMSLVLSHRTAWALHQTPLNPRDVRGSLPAEFQTLAPGPVDMYLVERARRLLVARGIPYEHLDRMDVSVLRACDRRSGHGVSAHVWSHPIPPGGLLRLDKGVFVVSPLLCLQQLAGSIPRRELAECLMEACGRYAVPPNGDAMVSREPLVCVDDVRRLCADAVGQRGVNNLRRTLRFVRDGARSPMETAFFLMLLFPRRFGGEGIESLEMAYRIEVAGEARLLTRRSHFECDAYLPQAKVDLEYNGILHEEEGQIAVDVERANALEAMGYRMMTITRQSFFDGEAFGRLMRAIERRSGHRQVRVDSDFLKRQEELRRFMLRRYLAESGVADDEAGTLEEMA